MNTISQKAKQLLDLRVKANEAKLILDDIKAEKDEVQNELMSVMAEEGFNSVKIEDTSISKAVRKSLIISNENDLITDLKKQGLAKEYVREQVDRALWRGLSTELIKENKQMDGTKMQETEFISIKTKKKGK